MTDLEISKALALAIGYLPEHVRVCDNGVMVYRPYTQLMLESPQAYEFGWYSFSANDWSTIGLIATKYDSFPCFFGHANAWIAGVAVGASYGEGKADTPQRAIALAVIEGAKK